MPHIFVIVQGVGGPDPLSPSGSAHDMHKLDVTKSHEPSYFGCDGSVGTCRELGHVSKV